MKKKYEFVESLLNNGCVIRLPSGKELYLSEEPFGVEGKGQTVLKVHTQDTDFDEVTLHAKSVVNGIELILRYDFDE